MSQKKSDGSPYKILWCGDLCTSFGFGKGYYTPSGFGRIGNEITTRLFMRGWGMLGASFPWSGWPLENVPYKVVPLGGREMGMGYAQIATMISEAQPDLVIVCQDFPYSDAIYHALGQDWSKRKFITLTPIDGEPLAPQWLKLAREIDALCVISRFGVEALSRAGQRATLVHPGVNSVEFHPAEKGEREALREKMGIPPDAFVLGSYMMNQGRKAVPSVIEAFLEFARDKPDAYLYLDMETGSPAGWDIPSVMQQVKAEPERIKLRENALNADIYPLRDRYIISDVSCNWAHREGFGLPNLEAMACGLLVSVLDWCSGTEIAGDGKGLLLKPAMSQGRKVQPIGTWGGARENFVDMADAVRQLNEVYEDRARMNEIIRRGSAWAREQTWEQATNQIEAVIEKVLNG